MKNLISLLIVGAFVAAVGAFVGKWTIPGLESMPTLESLREATKSVPGSNDGSKRMSEAERRLEMGDDGERPAGYFATGTGSASANRNRHLQNAGKEMGVEE